MLVNYLEEQMNQKATNQYDPLNTVIIKDVNVVHTTILRGRRAWGFLAVWMWSKVVRIMNV